MKKITIIMLIISSISVIFATTMIVHTTNGEQEFELSDITGITFGNTIGEIPTEGLIAYYPFNGNANDESGNELNGTPHETVDFSVQDRFGNNGSAVYFDGTSGYISVSGSALNLADSISICGWLFIDSDCIDEGGIVDRGPGLWNHGGYYVRIKNHKIDFAISSPYSQYYTETDAPFNEWIFFAVTYDNNTVKIHLNSEISDYEVGSGKLDSWIDDVELSIGKEDQHHFKGVIDDIRIYNRALTEEEINALYHEGGWN